MYSVNIQKDHLDFMTIEYLKCNFEVDFGSNRVIGPVATWWDLILFGE